MKDFSFKNTLIAQKPLKMRYSLEPNYRKYVKGYGFLSFTKNFGDNYGKKLMDNATKTGIDASKTAFKRVVQKTAEATGDLIGNKTADKITSVDKSKSKTKKDEINEMNETEEIYIPPEKRQQITKNCIEVGDQSGGTYNTSKQIRFKTSMLRSDLCDYNDAYIVAKGDITVQGAQNRDKYNRNLALKK